jgi:hypothetical protein
VPIGTQHGHAVRAGVDGIEVAAVAAELDRALAAAEAGKADAAGRERAGRGELAARRAVELLDRVAVRIVGLREERAAAVRGHGARREQQEARHEGEHERDRADARERDRHVDLQGSSYRGWTPLW